MGLFGENTRNFNEDFLKEKGYNFVKRGEFIKFMKSKGLNYKKDKITEELFNQYVDIQEKKEIKEEIKKEEKKSESAYSFNENFLKEHNIGFVKRGNVSIFMKSIGLNYNKDKLTEDLFNQYVQFTEVNDGKTIEEVRKEQEEAEKLGVVGYDFKCNLHEKRMNTWGQQKTEFYDGYCFIKEDRLVIKKRSGFRHKDVGDKVVPYSNINAIDYDKATGFHVTSSIVISISGFDTIILKNTTQENFQQLHDAWLNYNTKPTTDQTPQIIEKNTTTAADELLKYAELYKEGLLTKEEFETKKTELLNGNNSSSPDIEVKSSFCPNCGNKLGPNSKFCSNCGVNLN